MEEQDQNKISRSSARHLRRKRLIAAKREENLCESLPNSFAIPDLNPNKKETEKVEKEKSKSRKKSKIKEPEVLDSKVDASSEPVKETKEESVPVAMTSTKLSNPGKPGAPNEEKSREQIKAEREAKKAAKAAAKAKGKVATESKSVDPSKDTVDYCLPPEFQNKCKIEKIESPLIVQTEEKSKAELRAERRIKQEAQRALKLSKQETKQLPEKKVVQEKKIQKISSESVETQEDKKSAIVKKPLVVVKDDLHEVNLFKHLYLERKHIAQQISQSNLRVHPAILRLGVQYAEKIVVGGNARCVALLAAVKQLIQDYVRPPQADFARGLESSLKEAVAYLNHCRPIAVSMQNALRHLKWQMTTLSADISDEEAKLKLTTAIDTYINDQINLADKAISISIRKKICQDDVILIYGFSSLIQKILCDAYDDGKKFRVVVVDSRPYLEGKELLRRLVKRGLDCSYVLINALSYIMPQVSKVFLGAHAILANGAVMSRVGTAQIALMAKTFNVPVLVACETHKSCEQVQTDSIVYNEIGDPDLLSKNQFTDSKKPCLSNWRSRKSLKLLNITYDVTPAHLVNAVVTELSILPCTSVPVILRIKPPEL